MLFILLVIVGSAYICC
ncbi:YjcZ family sporulation protein [Shouchella clausii]|nr:YjcZ family sporulation protein [Shouchella clausii]